MNAEGKSAMWEFRFAVPVAPPTGGAVTPPPLPLSVPHQEKDNWCWAAIAVGVADFYGTHGLTQCAVANADLHRADCCGAGSSPTCNQYGYLERVLTTIGHSDGGGAKPGAATFQQVINEINAGRPVGVRIVWASGGAHFLAIRGYKQTAGQQRLTIEDPSVGSSNPTYSTLTSAYVGTKSNGKWSHWYGTR